MAAWVSLIVSISLQTAGVHHGLGKHYNAMTDDQLTNVAIFSISAGFAAVLATAWSKTSFGLSLLRISPTGRIRTALWIIIVLTNVVFGVNGLIQWIQCWPVAKLWHHTLEGSCWSSIAVQDYNTFAAGQLSSYL
jgi:hypothetical protein